MTVYSRATTVNRGSQGVEGDKFLTITKFNISKKYVRFKHSFWMNFLDESWRNLEELGGRNPFLSALSLFSLSLKSCTNSIMQRLPIYVHRLYALTCKVLRFMLFSACVSVNDNNERVHTAFPTETVTLSSGMTMTTMTMTMMSFLASDSSLLLHRRHHKYLEVTRRILDKMNKRFLVITAEECLC